MEVDITSVYENVEGDVRHWEDVAGEGRKIV